MDAPGHSLKSQWLQILLALADEALHGHGIRERVLEQTDGATKLWPAMLYGSLEQMVQVGLIKEVVRDRDRPEGASRQRRYYRITHAGREALATEARRWTAWAKLAGRRLGARGGNT